MERKQAGCGKKTDEFSRIVREITRRKQARAALVLCFGVLTALIITALLAMPHRMAEPVEVDAPLEEPPKTTAAPMPMPFATEMPTPSPTASASPTPIPVPVQPSDPLLLLVNAETPLPEDFEILPRTYGGIEVNALMYEDLCAMLDKAKDAGCVLWIASGYRSVDKQASVLENAVTNRMKTGLTREEAYENALRTIQKPGYSEHHTGLALDFNRVNDAFAESDEYEWLQEHAAEYGFVERYPQDKEDITGIEYEPWHYRYVGREHAAEMVSLGMCLEEYTEYRHEQGIQ